MTNKWGCSSTGLHYGPLLRIFIYIIFICLGLSLHLLERKEQLRGRRSTPNSDDFRLWLRRHINKFV
jgi:hypothetical protein